MRRKDDLAGRYRGLVPINADLATDANPTDGEQSKMKPWPQATRIESGSLKWWSTYACVGETTCPWRLC